MIRRLWVAFGVIALGIGSQGIALAIDCTPPPEQTSKEYSGAFSVIIGKLRRLSGSELGIEAKRATQDLLGKLPGADRVYLEQLMLAAYCSSLRDDKALSESRRGELLKEYSAEVRNAGNHQDSSAKTPAIVPPVSTHQEKKKTSGPQYKVSPPVKPLPRVDTKQPEGQKSQPAVPPNPSISQHSAGRNSPNIVGDGNQIYLNLKPDDMASFHVLGGQVAFNSRNLNQLIANTYIRNDAGEADIVAYSSGGIAKVTADQEQVINELRKTVLGSVKQGGGLHFTVRRNETKWFTVEGPVLSDDLVRQFKKGELVFYFLASVVIAEQNTTKVLEHCGFVIGDRPSVILNCPSSVKKQ